MNQILRCDWLPEHARWSYLACSGLPAMSRKKNFPSHKIIPLLPKLVWSRWVDNCLVLFLQVSGPILCLESIVPQTCKKRMRPISSQQSWPHTWSITHIYRPSTPSADFRIQISDFYYYALFTKYNKINIYRNYKKYKKKEIKQYITRKIVLSDQASSKQNKKNCLPAKHTQVGKGQHFWCKLVNHWVVTLKTTCLFYWGGFLYCFCESALVKG